MKPGVQTLDQITSQMQSFTVFLQTWNENWETWEMEQLNLNKPLGFKK